MRRVEANAEWSLFCPNEAPGLAECWGEAFDALYQKFEREGRAKRVIKAQQLWFAILEAQVGVLSISHQHESPRLLQHAFSGPAARKRLPVTRFLTWTRSGLYVPDPQERHVVDDERDA